MGDSTEVILYREPGQADLPTMAEPVTARHAPEIVRLAGKNIGIDLWYDEPGRLVRQEWVEDGHRTVVELTGVRH